MTRIRRWSLAATALVAALVVIAVVGITVVVNNAPKPDPGAFYQIPSPLPSGALGTVIRSEPIQDPPPGTLGWKILYLSTGFSGEPTAMSGLLFVPTAPPPTAGRDIVVATPGTVGVAPQCAVSLIGPAYWPAINGLSDFIAAGNAVVVPDYQGLGTPGPHPYLVGDAEAVAALDAARAAHEFEAAHAGTRFVVWGESQGGHAALFAGQDAASYAPEMTLMGVATAAPATELRTLFEANQDSPFGKLLSAYTLAMWSKVYPELHLDQMVTPLALPVVDAISTVCVHMDTDEVVAIGALTSLLKLSYLSSPPWDTQPFGDLLSHNTPGADSIGAPVLIAQGEADPLVKPEINAEFAARLCRQGETVDYVAYPGVGHLDAGQATAHDASTWIADRFAGKPPPTTCT